MPYLAIFDVFGYPLQPKHLGTCEQSIGEAMMAGVVPVVLNNPAERYIIRNGVTGIIADTQDEYCRSIEYLYHNPEIRSNIARNAVADAREKYSITRKMKAWEGIFNDILCQGKRKRSWDTRKYPTGKEIFIESIGRYGEIFNEYIYAKKHEEEADFESIQNKIINLFKSNTQWYSDNKGGVKQYLRYFPKDIYLNEWEKLLWQTVRDKTYETL